MMTNLQILRLPINHNGRDFVCGDIHGAYACVDTFLDAVNFDKSKDRLICAGDLVDRGPENEKCLELLYQDWFFMVMGNHEHMMLDFYRGCPEGYGNYWGQNGGGWGMKYLAEDPRLFGYAEPGMTEFIKAVIQDKIANLPYLITVEKKDGSVFHVIHAELPSDKVITDDDLADIGKFNSLATEQSGYGDTIIWGRNIFMAMYDRVMVEPYIRKVKRGLLLKKCDRMFNDNLSHIYSGHTSVRTPVTYLGQTNLDTMAWISCSKYSPPLGDYAGLTVTEPETGKFWKCRPKDFLEVSPLVIG